jgi:mono/diheme cytochrome c family protein
MARSTIPGRDHQRSVSRFVWLGAKVLIVAAFVNVAAPQRATFRPVIPKTWDKDALQDWATPLAGLNVRPTHISPEQYYALPVDNLKTYPVYLPSHEPPGYWEMLQRVGPKPMIEPEKLQSETDWVEAGRTVFDGADHIHLRTLDPKFVEAARIGRSVVARPDGVAANLRWVPTQEGVALSFTNRSNCHLMVLPDGRQVRGAPTFYIPSGLPPASGPSLINQVQLAKHFVTGGSPIRMGDEPLGLWLYRAFGMPWRSNDPNARLKTATPVEYLSFIVASLRGGAVPRWNGSLLFPAKVPDLIGIGERKYIDATGTHLNRGTADLMRYAALVSWAETTEFGPHSVLGGGAEMPKARRSDEALYALALYLQSLQPPPNPNPMGKTAKAGEKLFRREGCAGCHVPPLYTNNKLTFAQGFTPPKDRPATLDVLPLSVGTDPGLALNTRKGTGYYKVPSLKGVWYRGHYLHDGSAASLEEMFDPGRLKETHTPGGFTPPGTPQRAIKGHEFGLKLTAEERKQLIAFLRTL